MRPSKIGMAAVSAAAVGALALGGAAIANAADSSTPSSTATTAPSTAGDGQRGGPMGTSTDAAVTGAEADKVIAAVKAKDSAVTVTTVRKDPDGSYDALGTKAGAQVMVQVSKDLATVSVETGGPGGPGGRHGGPGGPGGAGAGAGTGTQSGASTNPADANGSTATS